MTEPRVTRARPDRQPTDIGIVGPGAALRLAIAAMRELQERGEGGVYLVRGKEGGLGE